MKFYKRIDFQDLQTMKRSINLLSFLSHFSLALEKSSEQIIKGRLEELMLGIDYQKRIV